MQGFCNQSCGRCTSSCSDNPPPSSAYSCNQQVLSHCVCLLPLLLIQNIVHVASRLSCMRAGSTAQYHPAALLVYKGSFLGNLFCHGERARWQQAKGLNACSFLLLHLSFFGTCILHTGWLMASCTGMVDLPLVYSAKFLTLSFPFSIFLPVFFTFFFFFCLSSFFGVCYIDTGHMGQMH